MSLWQEFRREVFGDPYVVWHEGADFTELHRAVERDTERVHGMLRAGLAEGDEVAAQALHSLGDQAPADALDLLRSALPEAPDGLRVYIGLALHRLTGHPGCIMEIASVLTGTGHWGTRINAAIVLRSLPPIPEAIGALHRGVTDNNDLVRYHSASTLLGYAGRKPDVAEYRDLFGLITARPDDFARAAGQLLDLLAAPSARSFGDPARFAIDIGPADHHYGYRRPARLTIGGVVLGHPHDLAHVPHLRNVGVNTTYPDREPDFTALRETLVHHGYTGIPESVALDVTETRSVLDAAEAALDADFDVFRWRRHDLLFGDRGRFAIELGPVDLDQPGLRICTVWANGHNLCQVDNTVYVPQFAYSLRWNLKTIASQSDFLHWGPTTDGAAAELTADGFTYELPSEIPGVADRIGVVQVSRAEISRVLDAAASALEGSSD